MMKKITAYKTEGGKLYEDEEKATFHEKEATITKFLKEYPEHIHVRDIIPEMIADELWEHKEDIYNALKKYYKV